MNRILIVFAFFLTLFLGVIVRLFYWQVIKGGELSAQARFQYERDKTLIAPRGNIYSSDGGYLVGRLDTWLVYATIPHLKEPSSIIANKLSPLIKNSDEDLLKETLRLQDLLNRKDVSWVPLKRKISNEVKKNILALELSGIGFEQEETRIYPEASAAAHMLGFVGKTKDGLDKGYFGLEGYYDLTLTGKPGVSSLEKDARGDQILLGGSKEVSLVNGIDLVTNIDKGVQLIVDNNLKKGIEKYGAKGGVGIVMNPKTGAILAMSSFPNYDPAKYYEFSGELYRNPGISDTFEPGSIFKVLVMASGLDSGVITPETICNVCSGPIKIDKYTINTWNNKYFPDSSMTDVIVHSDNVGMVYIGQKLGIEKMYNYLKKFGIGDSTEIDLQGEVSAPLREKKTWNEVDLATASFGQGVAVTPIQMIRAVGAIANGGKITTPQVVKKLKALEWEKEVKPNSGNQIISKEAASEVTEMMIAAAEIGESKWARIPGFKVAAKTGTAQIPVAGHYDEKRTNASFIAFAPAYSPKIVMLVILNEPTTSPWASETAAPTWYSIARELFPYMGIQPSGD